MFIGGVGVGAFTLEYGLFLLGANPAVQADLYTEITSVAGTEPITYVHLHRLPLLMKTVKEIMRSYPGGGGIGARASVDKAILLGRQIPPKTYMMINVLQIHHDERYWNTPTQFRPLRWGTLPLEQFMADDRDNTFVTFGNGIKGCPGRDFAYIQTAITVAHLVREFEIGYSGKDAPDVAFEIFPKVSTSKVSLKKRPHSKVDL